MTKTEIMNKTVSHFKRPLLCLSALAWINSLDTEDKFWDGYWGEYYFSSHLRRSSIKWCTPKMLLRIIKIKHESIYVIQLVASNPKTPSDGLEILSNYKDVWIRNNVASNPSTPRLTHLKIIIKTVIFRIKQIVQDDAVRTSMRRLRDVI